MWGTVPAGPKRVRWGGAPPPRCGSEPVVPDFDLFFLFRRLLVIFAMTYALVKLGSLIGRAVLRDYVYAQLAEMRPARFLPDVLHLAGLVVILAGVLYLHWR